jgi:hypothetical protein
LESILNCHEAESPISHIKKYELRKGNAIDEIEKYLGEHPETIIAFAYFDFDLYEPTKSCLKSILPHLTKGAVLAFNQLNCSEFPGETIAFKEILGTGKFSLRCSANNPGRSYLIFD